MRCEREGEIRPYRHMTDPDVTNQSAFSYLLASLLGTINSRTHILYRTDRDRSKIWNKTYL